MTKIDVEIDEGQLKQLVIAYISDMMRVTIAPDQVLIEVKPAQGFNNEWTQANFRARVSVRENAKRNTAFNI